MIKCKLDSDEKKVQKDIKIEQPTTKENQVDLTKTSPSKSETPSTISTPLEKEEDKEVNKSTPPTETKNSTKKQTKPKKKKKTSKRIAKIEFEDMTWDFGEITEGDIVKKNFKFKNVGNAPLQIIGADASCGCARPTVPFLDIAPGETNQIGITYNSVNKDGDQEPEIIIESNTYPKHTILKLFGTVKSKPEKEEKTDVPTKKSVVDSNAVVQDSTTRN